MPRDTSPDALETRARILRAAIDIAKANDGTRVSVRTVAARASVGIGTLRYHFPTQRALLDAVLSSMYETAMPDERIRDASVPAGERLMECLRGLLAPIGVDDQARHVWGELYRSCIDPAADAKLRAGYLELSGPALRRIESWLAILVEEGAVDPGDNAARSRYLMALVNGLAVQRALPSATPVLELEDEVLRAAVANLPASSSPGLRGA